MTTLQMIITKAPEFNGGQNKFFGWEMEFMSYAEEKGFAVALLEKHDTSLPSSHNVVLDDTIPREKDQRLEREKNAQAMRALIGSLKSDHDKHKIPRARKVDEANWPNRKAWTVWKALKKEYQPDDATAEAEMDNALP